MINVRTPIQDRAGYSLIELLTVMVILAILVHIAAPSLGGMLRVWRSKQASQQVAADLAYARLLAIRSGTGAAVVFNSTTSYEVQEGSGASATTRKSVDLTTDYGSVTLAPPTGVTQVVFNARGMVSAGAGQLVVVSASADRVKADTLWVSPLGMVRREG